MLYSLNPVKRALPAFSSSLEKVLAGYTLTHDEIVSLVKASKPEEIKALHDAAGQTTTRIFGNDVSLRGIVEFSNACEKRCHYCGVTSYEDKFLIPQESILECAEYMYENGYRNLVLQSGEITSESRISWICELLRKIRDRYGTEPDRGMCVIMSIGELSESQYRRMYELGAQRYLLRIESSNPELYASMHPPDHLHSARLQCLHNLAKIGYVTGTGSMVGVPNQTFDHVAQDIEFFRDGHYPMIGLGPYLIHKGTVMGKMLLESTTEEQRKATDLVKAQVTLNVYDTLRLSCPYINIAATTALDALYPGGKAIALKGGANVVMPVITPKMYRGGYQLYEGKKEVDMDREQTHQRVLDLMKKIGKKPRFDRWNHPPAFYRTKTVVK